jgi:hypothetical protein
MIQCRPKGFFSTTFFLHGEGHNGVLSFSRFREQGSLKADGKVYRIKKRRLWRNHWILEKRGKEYASAWKLGLFGKHFRIKGPIGELDLRKESFFSRNYVLLQKGKLVASLVRPKFFSRKSVIEIHSKANDFPLMAFAFWLILLSQKRLQRDQQTLWQSLSGSTST